MAKRKRTTKKVDLKLFECVLVYESDKGTSHLLREHMLTQTVCGKKLESGQTFRRRSRADLDDEIDKAKKFCCACLKKDFNEVRAELIQLVDDRASHAISSLHVELASEIEEVFKDATSKYFSETEIDDAIQSQIGRW